MGGVNGIVTILNDKDVHDHIKELVRHDRIQLTDQYNKVIFDRELKSNLTSYNNKAAINIKSHSSISARESLVSRND